MVFWALERKKQREQERKQRELENKVKNQAELLARLLEKGIIQNNQELEQLAQEMGIPFDKLPLR